MARISVNTKYNLQLAAHKGKNFYENTTHRYFFDDNVATDCIILKVTRVPKKYLGRLNVSEDVGYMIVTDTFIKFLDDSDIVPFRRY